MQAVGRGKGLEMEGQESLGVVSETTGAGCPVCGFQDIVGEFEGCPVCQPLSESAEVACYFLKRGVNLCRLDLKVCPHAGTKDFDSCVKIEG